MSIVCELRGHWTDIELVCDGMTEFSAKADLFLSFCINLFSKSSSIYSMHCTINLAISDVKHLILLTLVLYQKVTIAITRTGF